MLLAVHPLQSTSDRKNPVLYGAIAAAVLVAVIPEQSAIEAYQQKAWSDKTKMLTVVNSLLGWIHLSGRLHQLFKSQFELIAEGVRVC